MLLVTLRTKSSCSYWTIEFSTITLILILSFYHDIYLCKPAHCHFDLTLLLAWLFKTQLCVEDVRRLQGPCRTPLAVAVEGRCVLLSCLSLGHWVLFLLCLERTTWSCRGAMTVFFPLSLVSNISQLFIFVGEMNDWSWSCSTFRVSMGCCFCGFEQSQGVNGWLPHHWGST